MKRNKTQELHTLYALYLYLTVYNETALLQNNMFSFSVSDIKMKEGIFINLVEKHEELSDKKTKKAEQKSILKNDYLPPPGHMSERTLEN